MTSRSSAELAGKFYDLAAAIPRANRDAVENAALFAKEEFIKGGVAAGLTPGGNLPRASKARWGARYDIKGFKNPTALVRYVGPVHWAFKGTERHFIAARQLGNFRQGRRTKVVHGKKVKVRTRSARAMRLEAQVGANAAFGGTNRGVFGSLRSVKNGKRALTIPGAGTPKAYAFHPGHRGRNAWPIVQNRIRLGAPKVFAPSYQRAIVKSGFGR